MPLYTKKQARAAAYILTRNDRIQCLPQSRAWTHPVVVQKAGRAQEQGYKYTRKCKLMLENWDQTMGRLK